MKYILGLAFAYNFYKKPVVIRLSSDNIMIDEIVLTESIGRRNGGNTACIAQPIPEKWFYLQQKNDDLMYKKWKHFGTKINLCEKIFLYEIDGSVLGSQLTLDVSNDHNNFTNGFMTKFSYLEFDMVFLMPKKYFENLDLVDTEQEDIVGPRHGKANRHDHCAMNAWHWPFNMAQKYDPESELYVDDENENFMARGVRLGKSFTYHFDLTVWNGMKVVKPKNVSDRLLNEIYCYMNPMFLTYWLEGNLINRFNEDQRSHRQRTGHSRSHVSGQHSHGGVTTHSHR